MTTSLASNLIGERGPITGRLTRKTVKRDRNKSRIEAERVKQYGPPPTNPIKELRTKLDLTVQGCADTIGISKQALIRLEQGTYDRILPSVLEWFVNTHGVSELALVDGYEEFQSRQRLRHSLYFGASLDVKLGMHPLRELRQNIDVTPTEVAKALCLPHATLTYFEGKPKQQKSVPAGLVNVLHEIGYTGEQIRGFCRDYEVYRLELLRGVQ